MTVLIHLCSVLTSLSSLPLDTSPSYLERSVVGHSPMLLSGWQWDTEAELHWFNQRIDTKLSLVALRSSTSTVVSLLCFGERFGEPIRF